MPPAVSRRLCAANDVDRQVVVIADTKRKQHEKKRNETQRDALSQCVIPSCELNGGETKREREIVRCPKKKNSCEMSARCAGEKKKEEMSCPRIEIMLSFAWHVCVQRNQLLETQHTFLVQYSQSKKRTKRASRMHALCTARRRPLHTHLFFLGGLFFPFNASPSNHGAQPYGSKSNLLLIFPRLTTCHIYLSAAYII